MEFTKENIKLICADNMKIMAKYSDNYFDLACIDPEYGINIENSGTMFKKFGKTKGWDNKIPDKIFFDEIFRISKNQIVWGGNYFFDYLGNTKGVLWWDKMNGTNMMADGELAWTSFDFHSRRFNLHHFSSGYGSKIHPTQKPVKLYDFCFDFAKAQKEWKIIDTNFGSASSAISAYYFGFAEYVGIDIDSDYFNDAVKRFKAETMQQRLF